MSPFEPTLSFAITPAEFDDLRKRGITLEDIRREAIEGFEKRDFATQLSLRTDRVIVLTTATTDKPVVMTQFEAVVVAKFKVDGGLFLKLATGDVFEFEFVII